MTARDPSPRPRGEQAAEVAAEAAAALPTSGGTYALVWRARCTVEQRVGALGACRFEPGYYVYVGSAHGGGGLRARVARHLRHDKPCRWHMDYLRPQLQALAVWWQASERRLEDNWVEAMPAIGLQAAQRGFGASDSRHASHLFFSPSRPDFQRWRAHQPHCHCLRC